MTNGARYGQSRKIASAQTGRVRFIGPPKSFSPQLWPNGGPSSFLPFSPFSKKHVFFAGGAARRSNGSGFRKNLQTDCQCRSEDGAPRAGDECPSSLFSHDIGPIAISYVMADGRADAVTLIGPEGFAGVDVSWAVAGRQAAPRY